jgi:hypothetical protein
MSTGAHWMAAFGGYLAGVYLFNAMARWIATVWEVAHSQREDGSRRFSPGMAAGVSVFSSGPWTLVVVATIAYYLRGEPWWPWFIGGAVAGIGLLALLAASMFRRVKEMNGKNAA